MEPTHQQIRDNVFLRDLIDQAVRRETASAFAPLRDEMQLLKGNATFLRRDLIALQTDFGKLVDVVRGNKDQGIVGLIETLHAVKDNQEEGKKRQEKMLAYMRGASVAIGVLLALGVIDNPTAVSVLKAILSFFT